MTLLPIVCTATVENASDIVEVTGTDASTGLAPVLSDINCRPNATVFLDGLGYAVKARVDTTHFQLERVYAGVDATGVACTVQPFTPEMANRTELAAGLRTYSARQTLLEARGNGLHYVSLGATGAADPGPGKVSYVGASWAAATALCIDVLDAVGINRTGLIDRWALGDTVIVESIATAAYVAYELTEAPSNEGPDAWRKLEEFALVASDGAIVDDEDLRLVWIPGGEPGPGYEFSAEVDDPDGLTALEATATDGMRVWVNDLGATEYGAHASQSGVVAWNDGAEIWTLKAVFTGPKGNTGDQGEKGWAPQIVGEADGSRRVLKFSGYVGGAGSAPTANVGEYLKADGTFTATIGDAMDIRGAPGANGSGTVADVIEGTGITVDATDPTQPIVGLSAGTVSTINSKISMGGAIAAALIMGG